MNYSPEQIKNIWEKGKTLRQSLLKYSDSKLIPKYLRTPSNAIKENDTLNNLMSALQAVSQSAMKQNILLENLYTKLKNGKLIAVGYETPMKTTDFPIIVPSHIWDNPEINLQKSSVTGNGLNFLSVRIIKKSALPKLNKKSGIPKIILPKPNIVDKLVGRPSQKNDLISAFEWMVKNKRIDKSKSLKAHEDELNNALAQVNPNSKYIDHLNYKTINRHLGKRFNQYKKSQNQSQN